MPAVKITFEDRTHVMIHFDNLENLKRRWPTQKIDRAYFGNNFNERFDENFFVNNPPICLRLGKNYYQSFENLKNIKVLVFDRLNRPFTSLPKSIISIEVYSVNSEILDKCRLRKGCRIKLFNYIQLLEQNSTWIDNIDSIVISNDNYKKGMKLPTFLEFIDFDFNFSGNFDDFEITSNVEKIGIGNYIGQPLGNLPYVKKIYIEKVSEPFTDLNPFLQHIMINQIEKEVLQKCKLPYGCYIGLDCYNKLRNENCQWLDTIDSLMITKFEKDFDVKKLILPRSLNRVKIMVNFNCLIDDINFPDTIKSIEFYNILPEQLLDCLPKSLEILKINNLYRPATNLPPNLKRFEITYAKENIVKKCILPEGCEMFIDNFV